MRFIFFSLRNFKRDGGGSIRMYGILNALATKGHEVVFISNASDYSKFNSKIEHLYIDKEINSFNKRILQSITVFLPVSIVWLLYPQLLKKILNNLKKANVRENEVVYFFEYLDNTIGYLLKKKKLVSSYINDLHGISTIEFEYQYSNANNLKTKIVYYLKYKFAFWLDKKVFEYGDGFIYASEAMKNYYEASYDISDKKSIILPYVLGQEVFERVIDTTLKGEIKKKYNIEENDFVFFFAGGYKPTAGVQDLIISFAEFNAKYKNSKLILIGTGPTKNECLALITDKNIQDNIVLIEKIPYHELTAYQSVANVLVCPDRQNPYSELIVHLKYFDCLSSGILVINGNFNSVKEINTNDSLSLTFEPSNTDSLFKTMEKSYLEYKELNTVYKDTRQYTLENLTYESCADRLTH